MYKECEVARRARRTVGRGRVSNWWPEKHPAQFTHSDGQTGIKWFKNRLAGEELVVG